MMRILFQNTKPSGQVLTLLIMSVVAFILVTGITFVATLCNVNVLEVHNMMFFQIISQILCMLVPSLLFAWFFSDSVGRFLKTRFHGGDWISVLFVVLMVVAVTPFIDWLTRLNDSWHLPQSLGTLEESLRAQGERSQKLVEQFLSLHGFGEMLWGLFVMAVVPAICEEFIFRGALQQALARWFRNGHVAIVVTAAIFSIVHGEVFAFLPRFALGILLGYVFMYAGSIWVNVTLHFVNNAALVVMCYMYNEGVLSFNPLTDTTPTPWYVTVLATCVFTAIFVLFVLKTRRVESDTTAC